MKNLSRFISILMLLFTSLTADRNISIEQKIAGLYVAYFNRAPDKSGLDYWKTRGEESISSGNSISDVLKELSLGFSSHSTFVSTYTDLNNREFVESIYRNVLGKDGDSEGINYWTNYIDSGKSRSDMVSDFVQASLILDLTEENFPTLSNEELEIAQERQDLITNKVEVALNFINILGNQTDVKDTLNPENDSAYRASIKILNGTTIDYKSVSSKIRYLNAIKDSNNPIDIINGEVQSEYQCDIYGFIEYQGGSLYIGECQKDRRYGYGVMIYYEWGRYEGEWKDDIINGNGTYYYSDDSKYIGEWRDGKKDGNGIYYYANGSKYVGEWKDDKKDGNGTYYYTDGSKYEGEWIDNKRDGEGSYSSQYGTYKGVWRDDNLVEVTNQDSYEEAYNYFNEIRKQAGMIELEKEIILEKSAQSHSYYIQIHNSELEGLGYHSEIKGTEGFTGETAGDRAIYQGYFLRNVGEGISHDRTARMSINGLMTAIYHRFGILDFSKNEFGIGFTQESDSMIRNFLHNTGNSNLNELCQVDNFISGTYYYGVCKDLNHKIEKELYENAINDIKKQNPKYILWPPRDSKNNLYRFGNETPDPIPDYNETGNPVSIQFNDYYYSDGVEMKSFKLFKDGEEIKETRVLTKETDLNKRFSEYEFALFPLNILERNQEYRAEFKYIYNGEEKSIIWYFRTMEEF